MINKDKLIQSFEEIIGWPYVSPGSNDQNGIDCSGAFVRAFRAQGGSIYHGSNRMIRAHCRDAFQITNATQLEPGMAVFKVRQDGNESSDYKPGGKYYDPLLVGNFYHVGLVTGTNPLRIVHATTPVAKADSVLKASSSLPGWTWAAYLKDVVYSGQSDGSAEETPATTQYATVDVPEGENLRMRKTPSPSGEYMQKIPRGTELEITAHKDGYAQTSYKGFTGWVDERFLRYLQVKEPEVQPGKGYAVRVTGYQGESLTAEQAINLLDELVTDGYSGEVACE